MKTFSLIFFLAFSLGASAQADTVKIKLPGGGGGSAPTGTTGNINKTIDPATETHVFTGSEATWTMPAISGNTWKIIHIINKGTDELTLTGTMWNGAATTTIFVLPGNVATFQNDGSHWLKRN